MGDVAPTLQTRPRGRDFLPRGTGIVTRRPLVLQLRQLRSTGPTAELHVDGHWDASHQMPLAMVTPGEFMKLQQGVKEDDYLGGLHLTCQIPIVSPYGLMMLNIFLAGWVAAFHLAGAFSVDSLTTFL